MDIWNPNLFSPHVAEVAGIFLASAITLGIIIFACVQGFKAFANTTGCDEHDTELNKDSDSDEQDESESTDEEDQGENA